MYTGCMGREDILIKTKRPEGWPEGMPNRPHTRAPSRVWLFPAAPGVNRKYILHGDGRVGVELKELMIPGGLVSGQPKGSPEASC